MTQIERETTILSYLREDCSPEEIFRDYPSLPVDGIDAVARWAETTYGPEWRSMDAPAPQQRCDAAQVPTEFEQRIETEVDWDALMAETEAEWPQTLEHLGRRPPKM